MKKNITLLSLAYLMVACSEKPTDTVSDSSTKETTLLDTSFAETNTPFESVDGFGTIEDYAKLNTRALLVAQFGKENLVEGVSSYAEGSVEFNHTILTNPNSGHIVKYVWDDENDNALSFVEIYSTEYDKNNNLITQKIGTNCGLYTGMTIKEMRKWNGEDFEFSGFGWDYSGGVHQKENSKMFSCNVSLTLDLQFDDSNKYDNLYGDTELSTASKTVLEAPITLNSITLYID